MNIYRSISTVVHVHCIEYGWKKYLLTLRSLVPIVVMSSVKFVPSTITEDHGIQWWVWRIDDDDRWWRFLRPVFHWYYYRFDEYCQNTWIVPSAAEMFEENELWDEVVECYRRAGKEKKAGEVVRKRLSEAAFSIHHNWVLIMGVESATDSFLLWYYICCTVPINYVG